VKLFGIWTCLTGISKTMNVGLLWVLVKSSSLGSKILNLGKISLNFLDFYGFYNLPSKCKKLLI
jgi:hypothetical protein